VAPAAAVRVPAVPGLAARLARLAPLALLTVLTVPLAATAQDGLASPDRDRPAVLGAAAGLGPFELRLGGQPGARGWQGLRAQLFGDYFLTGPGFGQGAVTGGLRLTSGLTLGAGDSSSAPPLRLAGVRGAGLDRAGGLRSAAGAGDAGPGWAGRDAPRVTLPYLGIGYTSVWMRDGISLSADVGLGGLRPGERVRLGLGGAGGAQVDDVLNRLRLAPVLHLGLGYAF
jgi:hypothetical protein